MRFGLQGEVVAFHAFQYAPQVVLCDGGCRRQERCGDGYDERSIHFDCICRLITLRLFAGVSAFRFGVVTSMYMMGMTKPLSRVELTKPPSITWAIGLCISLPETSPFTARGDEGEGRGERGHQDGGEAVERTVYDRLVQRTPLRTELVVARYEQDAVAYRDAEERDESDDGGGCSRHPRLSRC